MAEELGYDANKSHFVIPAKHGYGRRGAWPNGTRWRSGSSNNYIEHRIFEVKWDT